MSDKNRKKINQLISEWPKGTVSVASYMNKRGYSHDLLSRYKKSKWIQPVGRGAYALYRNHMEWTGGLYAMQKQLGLDIHPGGKTALEMKGYAHFLSSQRTRVFLHGPIGQRLPAWFTRHNWNVHFVYAPTKLFPPTYKEGLTEYAEKNFSITISSPERAAMEMLYHVPRKVSYEESWLIVENLVSLRPSLVQSLLECCNSVKVKRLFMYMAQKHGHPWWRQIDTSRIDFGKGKRQIVKTGILDKEYLITVPKQPEEVIS